MIKYIVAHTTDKLILLLVFFLSLNVMSQEYEKMHPVLTVQVDESNYLLPTHGAIFFNPINQQIYLSIPSGFLSYTLEGTIVPPHKTRNYQEPGGMERPQHFFFYEEYFFVVDRLKVIKLDYDNRLLNETKGWFGANFVRRDGSFYYYNAMNCLELRDKDGQKTAENPAIHFKPKHKTSMVNYFRAMHLYLDDDFLWIDAMYRYSLLKVNPDSLEIISAFGSKPDIFREPDDSKTNVYGMQFINLMEEMCRGICHTRFIKSYNEYLVVYWMVESEEQGYVDIYDKGTLKLVKRLQLEDFHFQNNRSVDFDSVSGRLFQEDNINIDGDEQTILKVYDLTRYLDLH